MLSDAANSDTAVLGILGGTTAQVSVSLPSNDEDDLSDDDVVDDEVDFAPEDEGTADAEDEDAADDEAEAAAAADEAVVEVIEAEVVEDDEGHGDEPAPAASATAGGAASVPDIVDVEPVAAPAAAAEAMPAEDDGSAGEETSMDESRADRAHELERVRRHKPEVTLASKRLDEFEAGKETSDLLTADRLLEPRTMGHGEPEGAWQHFLYSVSGGRINLGDGKRARARKELTHRIAEPLTGGARFVPVLSRKGGVGKTTITTVLGMALADARDDRVIAIDANPDRGTLAERITRSSGRTVRDLVRMKDQVDGYNDVSTVVARDETRLDVLASDADPHVSEAFSDRDYEDVAALAAHYYSIVLTDTGTGIVHSVMGATLDLADRIVVVSGLSVDEARLASETLTWLETNGYVQLARDAIVVLNQSTPGTPLVRLGELESHFSTRAAHVLRLPYDPQIAGGGAIDFANLQPQTRRAVREIAAVLVEGLRAKAA